MKTRAVLTLLLLLIHLLSAMALLGLSGWFIAACALAGQAGVLAGFNYVVPAAVIRFLAIIRLASGYFEKYLGHLHLLERLRQIRFSLLTAVFNGESDLLQADSARTLQQQTEQTAALWSVVISPLLSLSALLVGMAMILTVFFPTAVLAWWAFVLAVALIIIGYHYLNAHWTAQADEAQADYLRAQQRWLRTSVLWSMTDLSRTQNELQGKAVHAGRVRRRQQNLMPVVETLLQVLGLLWCIPVLMVLLPTGLTPLVLVPLMLLISIRDWALPGVNAIAQASLMPDLPQANQVVADNTTAHDSSNKPDKTPQVLLSLNQFAGARSAQSALTAELQGPGLFLLTGPTGSGKSSLLLALLRELSAQGQASLNGQPLSQWTVAERRQRLHLAEQHGHVFTGTLLENLRMSAPTASEADCIEALRNAGLTEWAQPDRLLQWLGEGGVPISGGERKRLLLARALLSPAPVLLLDEPLEGLDKKTQQAIMPTLQALAQSKLVVVVSHIPLPLDGRQERLGESRILQLWSVH